MHLTELIEKRSLVAADIGYPDDDGAVVEIGAVRVNGWRIAEKDIPCGINVGERFCARVKLRRRAEEDADAASDDRVGQTACDLGDAVKRLKEFVGESVIAGHDANRITAFLSACGERCGVIFENRLLDTLRIAKSVYKDKTEHYDLASLAAMHGISYDPRYAVERARTVAELLAELALRDDFAHCGY